MRYARPRNRHSIQLILFERTGFRATTPAWPAPPTRSAACSPPSAARRPTSGMPAASHGGATATRKPPADVTTSTNNYKITKCGCNKAFSWNQVTVRPPREVPPPSRRKGRDELKSAAAFRITVSRTQLRHSGTAPIDDLDPDDAVPRHDRDRHRLAGSARAAVLHAITVKLTSKTAASLHRCPGPSTAPTNCRATRTRSGRPASVTVSRTASPVIAAPAFPARPAPEKPPGCQTDTRGWTPDSAPHVKPEHAASAAHP